VVPEERDRFEDLIYTFGQQHGAKPITTPRDIPAYVQTGFLSELWECPEYPHTDSLP
jgi:hypothetical protein